MAVMETRFQAIEKEVFSQRASQTRIEERQTKVENRLSTLEHQNHNIGSNIVTMMAHMNIPIQPQLPISPDHQTTDVAQAHHATAMDCSMGDTCF
jgi:FixJ family two-component response regulator